MNTEIHNSSKAFTVIVKTDDGTLAFQIQPSGVYTLTQLGTEVGYILIAEGAVDLEEVKDEKN